YCDTPGWDVYHRSAGFRRRKYRVRRYDLGPVVHLERKRRRGDRVRKKREVVGAEGLALLLNGDLEGEGPGAWFVRQVRFRGLGPACVIGYERTALVGSSGVGLLRLTLDRNVAGAPARGWELRPPEGGRVLLAGGVILELKFQGLLPGLFRELLGLLPPAL